MLADADATGFWSEAVRNFGIPGALFLVALVTGWKGWWLFRWVSDQREQGLKEQLSLVESAAKHNDAVWRARYDELKSESIDRLNNLRTEKDYWRQIALRAAHVAEVATDSSSRTPGG